MNLERLRKGARIADQLPKKMSLPEVAEAMGLSESGVRKIECLALWKISHRLKEIGLHKF